jgi:hypothetical protein
MRPALDDAKMRAPRLFSWTTQVEPERWDDSRRFCAQLTVDPTVLLKALFNDNPLIFALKYGNSSKSVTGGN